MPPEALLVGERLPPFGERRERALVDDAQPLHERRVPFARPARDAVGAEVRGLPRALGEHRMLQTIGHERIERHDATRSRLAVVVERATLVVGESRAATRPLVAEAARHQQKIIATVRAPDAPQRERPDEHVLMTEQLWNRELGRRVAALAARVAAKGPR